MPPMTNVRIVAAHDDFVKRASGVLRFTPGEQRDVPLTLRPGARVEGRITDAAGSPVPSARVRWGNVDGVEDRRLRDAFRADEYLGQRVIYSGADGTFVLDNIEPGKTLVKVERVGYAPWYRRDLTVLAEGTQPLLAVELEGALSISGRVVADRSGVPLREAVVYCVERGPLKGVPEDPGRVQALATVNTDATGRFVLEGVPPGRYDVVVWFATGYVGGAQDWRHERARRSDVESGAKGLEFRLVTELQRAEEEAE
jgi:protocatechuate 3,4-dioxygenase beta subunit